MENISSSSLVLILLRTSSLASNEEGMGQYINMGTCMCGLSTCKRQQIRRGSTSNEGSNETVSTRVLPVSPILTKKFHCHGKRRDQIILYLIPYITNCSWIETWAFDGGDAEAAVAGMKLLGF